MDGDILLVSEGKLTGIVLLTDISGKFPHSVFLKDISGKFPHSRGKNVLPFPSLARSGKAYKKIRLSHFQMLALIIYCSNKDMKKERKKERMKDRKKREG